MITTNNPLALSWKHNHEPGIRTKGGVVTAWPQSLGGLDELTQAEVDQWEAEYAALPPETDPDVELVAAIQGATTLDELKDALLGNAGAGAVKGRKPT